MTKRFTRNYRLIAAGSAIVVLAGGGFLWSKRGSSTVSTSTTITPTSQKSAPDNNSAAKSGGGSQGTPKQSSPSAPAQTSSSTELQKPIGPQLSSHIAASSDQLYSSCQSRAGIDCDIKVTNNDESIVKYVGKQTTNDAGLASFYWTPNQLGLTPGDWTVSAVASAGSDTVASIPETLKVSP